MKKSVNSLFHAIDFKSNSNNIPKDCEPRIQSLEQSLTEIAKGMEKGDRASAVHLIK